MAEGPSRKLAVILHADVVGSTRLVQQNETLAHARIQDAFRRFSLNIEAYGGVTHELRGDALVAEFARASDAVSAGLAFQIENTESNARLEDDLQPQVRIGISLGEVVTADNTVTGAGVVLAQRVEQLAEPGGVCITGAILEAVPQYLPLDYSDLGKQEAKGFDEPVHAYSATVKAGKQVPPPEPAVSGEAHLRKPNRVWTAGAIALLVLVVGGLAWWQPWVPREEPASIERMAFPLPDKPSIAVLPFTNMSDDPKQEYFVDGMTEDLITDLSKLSGLFVIARNSVFTYKGKPLKVQQVAEELGVRFVLEGSVRRAGNQIRVNAQLIDSKTGGHLWADRYDGALTDVFALQDEMTDRIVKALAITLTPRESEEMARIQTDNVAAHDAYLLGLSFYYRDNPEDNAKAGQHFERAIELDADYLAPYAALAKVYARGRILGDLRYSEALGVHWRHALLEAFGYLQRATEGTNSDVHVVRSWLALKQHQHDVAIAEAKRALELRPNDADAMEALAEAQIYAGQSEAGIAIAQEAMRQNPVLVARPLYLMGLAEFALGNSEKTVELIERSRAIAPDQTDFAAVLAAAYGELDMIEKATAAFLVFAQGFRQEALAHVGETTPWHPFADRVVLERFAEGLKTAGALDDGYLPLHKENKLTGPEIRSLLFGAKIKGTEWFQYEPWQQQRTADGVVEHSGYPIHTGKRPGPQHGISRIDNDRLCESWRDYLDSLESCVAVFRMPETDSVATRRGEFVMVTALAPQPFRVIK